jgi:integrase
MVEIASSYCDERAVTPDYRQALLRVARSMRAAGITPMTLTDSLVNRWLASLSQSPTTRSNYRRMAVTLWRHAHDLGVATDYPKRLARVKSSTRPPVAWTLGEMSALVSAARQMKQRFKRSRCPMADFYEAFVRVGFETGLRFSDLLSLRCEQLREGRLYVVPNKTGAQVPKRLSASCVESLAKLSVQGDGETFFRWAICKRRAREHFKKLCRSAGLQGTPRWLRRTGATHCEISQPGSATRFLGHLSPGLAYKFYVDRTQLDDQCPSPPPIPTQSTTDQRYSCVSGQP